MNSKELPLGFGMALAQNEQAMMLFESMTEQEKLNTIKKAKSVSSKSEMHRLVDDIGQRSSFQ